MLVLFPVGVITFVLILSIFSKYYLAPVPSNLSLGAELAKFPIQLDEHKDKPQVVLDKLHYTLGLLYWQYKKQRREYKIYSSSDYVRICTEGLSDVIGNKYKRYLQWLTDRVIIESNGSYQKNPNGKGQCIGYRYTEKYRAGIKSPKLEYVYYKAIVTKVEKFAECQTTRTKYQHLYNHFEHLDYDSSIAAQIMNGLYKDSTQQTKEDLQYHLLNKIRYAGVMQNFITPFRTGETGRLYTPLSNIKKELRSSLRYKGEPLVEVDIKSSIPWISTFLLDIDFIRSKEELLTRLSPKLFKKYKTRPRSADKPRNIYEYYSTYIMLGKKEGSTTGKLRKPDVERYIHDIRSGDIYVKLANEWNYTCGAAYNRRSAKKRLLSILNSPNNFGGLEKDVLRTLYPNVVEYFDALNGWYQTRRQKQSAKKNGKPINNNDKSGFAFLTQGLESHFVLDNVSAHIMNHYPEIAIFTLHDSIHTTDNFKDIVTNSFKLCSQMVFKETINLA